MPVCWHEAHYADLRGGCRSRHDGDGFIDAGRTRSGKRWFWCAIDRDGVREHSWADTEAEAVAAYRRAAGRIAGGRDTYAYATAGTASRELKRLNAAKRAAKPAPATAEAGPVEYLYGTYYFVSDDYTRPDTYGITEFPITRKTAKRVYYLRNRGTDTGFVDREALERDGHVKNRGRSYYDEDYELHATEAAAQAVIDARTAPKVEPVDLAALRRAAVEAHPDRGGSNEEFRKAHDRYLRAKHRAKAQAAAH